MSIIFIVLILGFSCFFLSIVFNLLVIIQSIFQGAQSILNTAQHLLDSIEDRTVVALERLRVQVGVEIVRWGWEVPGEVG